MTLGKIVMTLPLVAALVGCGLNSVPTAEEAAKAQFANVQNAYQRRVDLLPNLEAAAKGAAASERGILVDVANARARASSVQITANDLTDPAKMQQFASAQNALSATLINLRPALQETNPNLKSQDRFADLMTAVEGSENRINVEVRAYNKAVQDYNTRIRTFPDAIGAKVFHGAKPMVPFQLVTPGAEQAPKLDFGS